MPVIQALNEVGEGLITPNTRRAKGPVPPHPGQRHHTGHCPVPAVKSNSGTSHIARADLEVRMRDLGLVLEDLAGWTHSLDFLHEQGNLLTSCCN